MLTSELENGRASVWKLTTVSRVKGGQTARRREGRSWVGWERHAVQRAGAARAVTSAAAGHLCSVHHPACTWRTAGLTDSSHKGRYFNKLAWAPEETFIWYEDSRNTLKGTST